MAPKDALDRIRELSSEVRAAVILDPDGALVAHSADDETVGAQLGDLARALVDEATAAAPRHELAAHQVEVVTAAGAVFGLIEEDLSLVVAAPRYALPSLMFTDMRRSLVSPGGGGVA